MYKVDATLFLPRRKRGFTAVELLTVVLLVAIFAAMALPSFNGTLKRYRISTAASEIANALQLARANAIRTRNNTLVSITSQIPPGCNAPGWGCGIDVWVDNNPVNGKQDPGELLKTLPDTDFTRLDVQFQGNAGVINVAYTPLGFLGYVNPDAGSGVITNIDSDEAIYVWQLADGNNPALQSVYVNTVCLVTGGKISIVSQYVDVTQTNNLCD